MLCAGLAAGLTIGLVSIDKNELSLILINGTPEEKRQARAILPIIKDHHWLLVTLFLFNAAANEAMPLFLGDLVPRVASVIIATFTVLIFGEIIPSSIFSGPSQMKLAASLSGVVYILMAIFYPVARPIGLFLDFWLGKHTHIGGNHVPFNAKDLYTLLSMARRDDGRSSPDGPDTVEGVTYGAMNRVNSRVNSRMGSRRSSFKADHDIEMHSTGSPLLDGEFAELVEHQAPPLLKSDDENDANLLDHDVVTIAQGAIVCSRIFVDEISQPTFFTIDADRAVTLELLEEVGRTGYSRIPVSHGPSLLGYIVAKELLGHLSTYLKHSLLESHPLPVGEDNHLRVRDLAIYPVQYCAPTMSVLNALNALQTGESRIGVVTDDGTPCGHTRGYFTLEDVMEEIIQEEIDDEKDSNKRLSAGKVASLYSQAPGAGYISL